MLTQKVDAIAIANASWIDVTICGDERLDERAERLAGRSSRICCAEVAGAR